ncbi:MAG TPA: flagellar export protein FliJ [Conexibacter sp.]
MKVAGDRPINGVVTAFRFRLERVRALRERGEDLAKEELAGALSRRSSCEERLREAGETLDAAREQQRDLAAVPVSASDLMARQLFLERAERDRTAGQQDLVRHDTDVEAHRDRLREAARDRQALERLKERQRADHARELARVEGNTLDEIALTVHRRRAS